MIRIYQIGNYRVNLVPSSKQGLKEDYSTVFRRPADVLTGISGDITYLTPGKPLVTAGKWSFEGTLICGAGATCAATDQEFNHMIASGGDVVSIIAAVPAECCPCSECGGIASCPSCSSSPEAQWLVTQGTITKYKPTGSFGMGDPLDASEIPISLTIVGPTHWEPLNDVEWQFYGRNKPTYPETAGVVKKRSHPFKPRWHGALNSGFQKIVLDGNIMLDPANWILGYSSTLNRRMRAVLTSDNSATPTITVINPFISTHVVDPPYINWPAKPESLYYFTNIPTEGELLLSVETLTPHGVTVISTASLDLELLNQNTALGELGILGTDTIIIGMRGGTFIRYYLRNGTYPLNMYIPWVYSGDYPGETLVGRNIISAEITAEDTEIDMAYLHVLRRY